MEMSKVHDYAKLLIDLHGDKAEVEAARMERDLEASGDTQKLEIWRRIRASIRELRGPHVS
jgi:hypothetical protein